MLIVRMMAGAIGVALIYIAIATPFMSKPSNPTHEHVAKKSISCEVALEIWEEYNRSPSRSREERQHAAAYAAQECHK